VVARLASYDKDSGIFLRHFGAVEQACMAALHRVLPRVADQDLARGLGYCRLLFERELMERCSRGCGDHAEQRQRSDRLIAFLAAGLHTMAARGEAGGNPGGNAGAGSAHESGNGAA
jgi:hypothetical protein